MCIASPIVLSGSAFSTSPRIRSSLARLPKASTRWAKANVVSPASVVAVTVLRIGSMALTRPMTNRVRRIICRIGATTCSGKIDAPTASGSIGLNVV
jgi:hypothetical protein